MNQIRCFIKVTLVPMDSNKRSRGPFECGFFRALPEAFYSYPDASETGDPFVVDMIGTPYIAIAEVGVGLAS